jgi:hypothetical protein
MHMTDCFFALMGNALLACASIATEREADASSAHPRVLGLPLPLAILSITLVIPLFCAVVARVGRIVR